MLIVVVLAALFGIWRSRTPEYFKWVAVLFVWMAVGTTLFSIGGTIADPRGDGLITREVRRATENRADMGIFVLSFLALYWGGAGLFVARMARAFRVSRAAGSVAARATMQRQIMETVLVLVASGAWAWHFWF